MTVSGSNMENWVYEPSQREIDDIWKLLVDFTIEEHFIVIDRDRNKRKVYIHSHEVDHWEDEYVLYDANTNEHLFENYSPFCLIQDLLRNGWKIDIEFIHNRNVNKIIKVLD